MRSFYHCCRFIALSLFVFLLSWNVNAQTPDVSIDIDLPPANAGGNRFSVCGETQTVCVTLDASNVTAPDTAQNVRTRIFFLDENDMPVVGLNTSAPYDKATMLPLMMSGDSIIVPDLENGDSFEIGIDVMASCDFVGGQLQLFVEVVHDTTSNGPDASVNTDDAVGGVGIADVSQPLNVPNPPGGYDFDPILGYDGLVDNTLVDIFNNGNGSVDTIYYCIDDSAAALINFSSIDVVQKPAPFGDGTTFTNITAFVIHPTNSYKCFVITAADFPVNGPGLGPIEGYNIREHYEVIDCGNDPTINRVVTWGCNGVFSCPPSGSNPGNFLNSELQFDIALPEVTATLISQDRPECFADNASVSVIDIENIGDAPYTGIYLDLIPTAGVITGYTLVGPNGPLSSITGPDAINTPGSCGSGSVIDSVVIATPILPGEIVTLTLTIEQDCACFDACAVFNVYGGAVRIRGLETTCGTSVEPVENLATVTLTLANNDERQQSLDEAPIAVMDGQTGTVRNTFTSSISGFFSNPTLFPDAQYEFNIDLACGLDIVAGSFIWRDVNGDVFPVAAVVSGDPLNAGGATTHTFTFDNPAAFGDFSMATGHFIEYDVIADCAEYFVCNPPTGDCQLIEVDLPIAPNLNLYTGDCTNCDPVEIWCPVPTFTTLFCTTPGPCPGTCFQCDSFGLERVNYGLGDMDNDTDPDGIVDLAEIRTNRFIQGDSIKATFFGSMSGYVDGDGFEYGYARVYFNHDQFTPFGAEVTYYDDDEGETYSCPVTPFTKVVVAPDSAYIEVNFSIMELQGLGCMTNAGFTHYGDNDSVRICLYFQIKEDFSTTLTGESARVVDFPTELFISDVDDALYANGVNCFPCDGRLTQIGYTTEESCTFNDFGACELPANENGFEIVKNIYFGGEFFDEFPFEVRPVALPKTITFTKPSNFIYSTETFEVILSQQISGGGGEIVSGIVPTAFLNFSGDVVTFLAQDYFESLGDSRVWPDEGFQLIFRPDIQGSCASIREDIDLSYQVTTATSPTVFCTDMIMDPIVTKSVLYEGAALLSILDGPTRRVCSAQDSVILRVQNTASPAAANAFIYWNAPTNGIVVKKIRDFDADTFLVPNAFGIYPIGLIPGGGSKRYEFFVELLECGTDVALDVVTGWDCAGYPTTIDEATCQDISTTFFTTPPAGLNLNLLQPGANQNVSVCDTVTVEAELISTNLGFLKRPLITFNILGGFTLVPGTFEISKPSVNGPSPGTYMTIPDPVAAPSGIYTIDFRTMFADILEAGIPGSKDPINSAVSIRFKLTSDCDTKRGRGFVRLVGRGRNTCGMNLPAVVKRTPCL